MTLKPNFSTCTFDRAVLKKYFLTFSIHNMYRKMNKYIEELKKNV